MNELTAILAFHVIALTTVAVRCADIFVACGRFLIDNILVDQAFGSKAVQTSIDSSLSDIDSLCPEMV
jgi:hypothetical protein